MTLRPPNSLTNTAFRTSLDKLLDEYDDVTGPIPDGLPDRSVQHHIPLEPDAPVPQPRTYRLSARELQELREQLEKLLKKGWIRPSSSPYGVPQCSLRSRKTENYECVSIIEN